MSRNNFINIEPDEYNLPIYRVMRICHLFTMIGKKENVLVKPSKWDDPFENIILRGIGKVQDGVYADLDNIREAIYGQCWTEKIESDAIWRIYTQPKENGVKIKTTINKLFHSLYDVLSEPNRIVQAFIGKVKYYSHYEIIKLFEYYKKYSIFTDSTSRKIISTLLFKRDAFEHENELRLIYQKEKLDYSNDIYNYEIDPFNLIEEIEFDPRIKNEEFENYKSKLIKLGFPDKIIQKSKLYDAPPLLIIKI